MRWLLSIRRLALSLAFYVTVTSSVTRLPIGGFFEHETHDAYRSFHFSVDNCNVRNATTGIQFEKYETVVDVSNTFELNRAICCMLAKGVLALVGTASFLSQSMVESMARSFRIPYIASASSALRSAPSASLSSYYHSSHSGTVTFNLQQQEYTVYMRPLFQRAIMDLIIIYRWSSLIYLYDNNEGLKRFQELVAMREGDSLNISMTVYHFLQPSNAYAKLRQLDSQQQQQQPQSNNYILDFSSDQRLQTVLQQVISLGMHRTGYNYIVHSLNLNEMHIDRFPFGGGTLTGFRLVSSFPLPVSPSETEIMENWRKTGSRQAPGRNEELTLDAALVMDSISVLLHGFRSLLRNDPIAYRQIQKRLDVHRGSEKRSSGCVHSFANSWSHGPTILRHIKQVNFSGLTGPVSFDKDGHRQNFQLDILQAKLDHNPIKIGEWHSSGGPVVPGISVPPKKIVKRIDSNKTRVVVSVISRPYLMWKKRRDSSGRRFEGFCSDLAELVAEIVGFNYTIRLSRDGNYGIERNGSWNGMMGELVAQEADLAIAPLTITAIRERLVDFSIPFMSLGVSIMIKRPDKLKPGVFSFLDPLSLSIWVCIVIAYLVVSFVLFLVSRTNSVEWGQVSERSEARPTLAFVNNFTFKNSLWFALGGFMRQGCDISPRSFAGRVAGSSWWFFTLIIISSYTANLAAFLTVERMVTPIESADDLAKQTDILYGTLDSGSTKEFFQTSRVETYKRMWSFMKLMETNNVFVKSIETGVEKVRNSKGKYAFLLESTMNEYYNQRKPCNTIRVGQLLDYKGYGIATPIGSDLRDSVSLAVLQLMEDGDLKKLQKKWWYDKGECPTESDTKGSSSSSQSALTLSNVAGIFYILIVGLSLSVVVSILQFLCISNIEARRNRKVTIAAYRRLRFQTGAPLPNEETLFNNTNDRWRATNCSGPESQNRLQVPATMPAFRSSVISLV